MSLLLRFLRALTALVGVLSLFAGLFTLYTAVASANMLSAAAMCPGDNATSCPPSLPPGQATGHVVMTGLALLIGAVVLINLSRVRTRRHRHVM